MRFTTLLTPLAKRFVAGETADEAVAAAKRVNALGINAIIDFLGEDVNSEAGAIKASAEYIYVLGLLRGQNARVSLSLKLSQMGLLISEDLCVENLAKILAVGAKQKVFVWIDMEGSALTQRTIQVFDKLRSATPLIGLCLQAYLVRTGADLDRLMRRPFSVRLCKG
ncbi:MAG TPA: proline dehydrogenase family protein, partial [Elusimicrobiota bacterium]|nr:proline dehydrogenase family protein [Elusimicrobiota bacterium]